jgi:hypothetical protein
VRELVFALTFQGTAGPAPGAPRLRRARSTAPSQTLRTVLTRDGVESAMEPVSGATAVLESTVERFDDGTFVEWGTIAYGALGAVSFETVGRGVVGDGPEPGGKSGAVVWTVTSGTGHFAGARGLITSNFAVNDRGEVVDHHVTRLYLSR